MRPLSCQTVLRPLAYVLIGLGLALLFWGVPIVAFLRKFAANATPYLDDTSQARIVDALTHCLSRGWILKAISVGVVKFGMLLAVASSIPLITRAASLVVSQRERINARGAAALLCVILALSATTAMLTTSRINFGVGREGPGYGHDGVHYGRIADNFELGVTSVSRPFCHRPLPSLIVFYSELGTLRGFLILNTISFCLSCLLMYRMLRFYRLDRYHSIMGVCFLAFLKFGLKFWLYYPVSTDAFGTFLMIGVLYGSISGKHLLYALCMCLACLSRENLLALLPFHILCTWNRTLRVRATMGAAIVDICCISFAAFFRALPVVQPCGEYSSMATVAQYATMVATSPGRRMAVIYGYINSLGVLVLAPLFMRKRSWEFLKQHYCWWYVVAINAALSVVGGIDVDRFAVWHAPFLILLMMKGTSARCPPVLLARLLVLQVIWSEIFLPWAPDVSFYLSRYAAHSTSWTYVLMEFSCILLSAVVFCACKDHIGYRLLPSSPSASTKQPQGT